MNEIKLYKSPLSAFFLFLGGFILVVGGVFLINTGEVMVGCLCVLFFGLCTLVGLVMIFDKKPQIIINQKGIGYKKAIWKKYNPDDIIEWETINQVYWASVNNQKFVCLNTTSSKPKKQSVIQKLNKEMGFQETNIPLSMIKIDANKFVDFLGSMAVADDLQKQYLIQNFIIPRPQGFFSKLKSKFKF